MFLLSYAGVIVGAAMLYWFPRYLADKPLRLFILTAVFAVVFVIADSYIKGVSLVAYGGVEALLSSVFTFVPALVLAALIGAVGLYLLARYEERLDNWILTYVGALIALMFV